MLVSVQPVKKENTPLRSPMPGMIGSAANETLDDDGETDPKISVGDCGRHGGGSEYKISVGV